MNARSRVAVWVASLALISAALAGIATAAVPIVKEWWKGAGDEQPMASVQLVPDQAASFEIPAEVARMLGLDRPQATATVEQAQHPRRLEMGGTLRLDDDYYVRIHSRFPGEVVRIGDIEADDDRHPGKKIRRPLSFGDKVHGPVLGSDGQVVRPGQLLAEIWSKDLGEKKSDLVDAISQYRVDQETLRLMLKYANSIPPRNIREQEAKVAQGRNAIFKVERTLLGWRLTDAEIEAIKKEANEIYASGLKALPPPKAGEIPHIDPLAWKEPRRIREWGRVEVRAPFDGTILEKNIRAGYMIQDPTIDLFKIADTRHLTVWAQAYEEDLPRLLAAQESLARKKQPFSWTVAIHAPDGSPKTETGTIAQVGNIIDPNQHTAPIMGHVDNPRGHLRAGQFVTVTVDLPPAPDEVELPTAALIENGAESTLLIQPDPGRYEYQLRKVAVARRNVDYVCLRTRLSKEEEASGLTALRPGERVLLVAVLELTAAYKERRDAVASGKR